MMNMKRIKKFLWGIPLYLSTFVYVNAAEQPFTSGASPRSDGLVGFLETVGDIMGMLVPIFLGLALIYFIYGLAEYILVSGEESEKEKGRTRMIWGTIAMFVIVSVWGIVKLIQETVGVTDKTEQAAPKIPK